MRTPGNAAIIPILPFLLLPFTIRGKYRSKRALSPDYLGVCPSAGQGQQSIRCTRSAFHRSTRWKRSRCDADERDETRVGRPRGTRILIITDGSLLVTIIPRAPSQYGQWLWRPSNRGGRSTSRERPLSKGMPLTALGRTETLKGRHIRYQ